MLRFLGAGERGRPALVTRHVMLQAGLLLFGVAIALVLRSHLGLPPWDVLHQGIALHSPLSIGEANELVGGAIIAGSWLMGVRPGFGTVCNMLLVGFWLDRILALPLIPDATDAPVAVRLAMVVGAVVMFGVASGMYIAPRLGAGPRDSFMLAVTRRTGLPVAVTRGTVECCACLVGFLLGGPVGVGTLLTAFLIGPATQAGFRVFHVDAHRAPGARVATPEPLTAGLGAR